MRNRREKPSLRLVRLQQILYEEMARLFQYDLGDPALASARVTGVTLSADYRSLRVDFVCREGSAARPEVLAAASRVTPWVRRRIPDAVELDRLPEVRLVFQGFAVLET